MLSFGGPAAAAARAPGDITRSATAAERPDARQPDTPGLRAGSKTRSQATAADGARALSAPRAPARAVNPLWPEVGQVGCEAHTSRPGSQIVGNPMAEHGSRVR